MSRSTVHSAVQNSEITTKKGLLQRAFAVWFDAFVYNQIWEDPRVDRKALLLDHSSRVLAISSGGCNALDYLIAGVESVTAVDLNRHHIFLLDLKKTAIRHLPSYERFFAFFGRGGDADTGTDFQRYIADYLDKEALDFWETNTLGGSLLFGDRIGFFRGGKFYDHSRNGYFLHFFHKFAHLLGFRPEEILRARDLPEQEELFLKNIDPFFQNAFIKFLAKMPITLFGLGIPPQQYDELVKDLATDRTIIDVYRERVRKLACGFPMDENYFAWQAFARKYDTQDLKAVPEYLKPENFETLRQNIGSLDTRIGSVTDVIRFEPVGRFDRFVFLDAQDWMNAETLTELWTAVADRGAKNSRIIFRTAGERSPLSSSLPNDLLSRFHYEEELSRKLFAEDRASIYGGFHLYTKL